MAKSRPEADWRKKLPEAEIALDRAEKRHGPDHPKLCRPLINLATALLYTGKQREAIELFHRCHQIYSRVPDPNPKQLYEIFSCQALACTMLGHYEEAIAWFRRALGALDGFKGECKHERISLLQTLGMLHNNLSQVSEAKDVLLRALALCGQGRRKPDPELPGIYNGLSGVYMDLEQYGRSEELCRRALEEEARTNGTETRVYAVILNRLGKLAMYQGRLDEAEMFIRQSLELRERTCGILHPDYAFSLLNTGELLLRKGEHQEAEKIFYHLMTIVEGSLAPDHFLQWMVRHQFARFLIARGFLESAEAHLDRALEILERTKGTGHPDTAKVLLTLADLHLENKCFEAALEGYHRAEEITVQVFGPGHPQAARALKGMAEACEELGRHGEAREHRARAEEIMALLEQNGNAPKSNPHPENFR